MIIFIAVFNWLVFDTNRHRPLCHVVEEKQIDSDRHVLHVFPSLWSSG